MQPYGGSKAANEAILTALAQELDGSGVTANVLVPGGAADTRLVPRAMAPDRSQLPRPLAANLGTGTPEQCGVLPNPQRPDNAECVRKRSKEYAERLVRWLEEHPEISKFSEDVDPG
jgi:NAD(P)-dependent dehydrogenase (short-subunit alcohol dehydrogenase family)